MARIRSIHPGIFTDEGFASLSMAARVLLLGIWTEADDHGVFEWKPVTLKMRVMPVDNVSIPELLAECERADVLKKFSSGKTYGLVRNFCRFQRPKKPKYTHPMPQELFLYAGLAVDGSLPVLHQSRTGTENHPQREEGGDCLEDEKGLGGGAKPAPAKVQNSGVGKENTTGSSISLDFVPSAECRKAIAEMGFADAQYNSEFSKFVAYYMARGYARADWNAALISWFQRTSPDAKPAIPELAIANKVFVVQGTLEWTCWQEYLREQGKRSSPCVDSKQPDGRSQPGWYFVSQFPPGFNDFGERIEDSVGEVNVA